MLEKWRTSSFSYGAMQTVGEGWYEFIPRAVRNINRLYTRHYNLVSLLFYKSCVCSVQDVARSRSESSKTTVIVRMSDDENLEVEVDLKIKLNN